MSDRHAEGSLGASSVGHPSWHLEREASGGFVLESGVRDPIRVTPEAGGWTISGSAAVRDRRLSRPDGGEGGFVLLATDGVTETARSSRLSPGSVVDGPSYVLLEDGRLFCVALTGPREAGVELRGWETPGAYLVARPEGRGWRISPTPACSGLQEIDALSILFAAEILDAGRELS